MDIQNAAKLLGRRFVGKTPEIHGVSIRRRDPNLPILNILVDVDTDEVAIIKKLPSIWYKHKVYFRIAKMAVFAKENSLEDV